MISYDEIKKLCEKKGVTVTQCERDCGFSKGSLCKIEKSKPNAKRLMALSEYFGISMDALVNGQDVDYYIDQSSKQIAEEIYQNKELHMLFDAARDVSHDNLIKIRDILLVLKKKESRED